MEFLKANNEKTKHTADMLPQVVNKLKDCHSDNLVSVLLFGSAAEDRLRNTSDVNLLLVLKSFNSSEVEASRETLRMAKAAINLSVMYLLESELASASEAFAVKFQDIRRRHVLLYGTDVIDKLEIPPEIVIRRLKQVLLNMVLRMRERYVFVGQREEQLQNVIAEFAGPLRTSASEIIFLKHKKTMDPKSALTFMVQNFKNAATFEQTLKNISNCREAKQLPKGESENTVLSMISIAELLRKELESL